jgi:hypothetical protein
MSLRVRNSFSPTSRSTQNSQDTLPSSRPPTYNSFDDPQPASSVTSRDNGSAHRDASLRNAVNGVLRDAGSPSPQDGIRSRINRRQSMLTISARDPAALLDPRYRKHFLFIYLNFRNLQKKPIRKVYYRVYTENGEMPSKYPINKKDPSLTRIRALSVAPPHTVASIKRCLCSIEKIGDYNGSKIFSDLSSEDPLEEGHIPLMAYEGPGATPEWPMVLVRPPLDQVIRVKHAWTPGAPKFILR